MTKTKEEPIVLGNFKINDIIQFGNKRLVVVGYELDENEKWCVCFRDDERITYSIPCDELEGR